jgi:hypothetical protein
MSAHTGPAIATARTPVPAAGDHAGAGRVAAPAGVISVTIRQLGGGLRWDGRNATTNRRWKASAAGDGLRSR